jgi:hypothetical protein
MLELEVVTVQQMDNTESMKLPAFDGTVKAFPVFWMRFTEYATMIKFSSAIKETPELLLPDMEEKAAVRNRTTRMQGNVTYPPSTARPLPSQQRLQ